jgi:hypothetical protein
MSFVGDPLLLDPQDKPTAAAAIPSQKTMSTWLSIIGDFLTVFASNVDEIKMEALRLE